MESWFLVKNRLFTQRGTIGFEIGFETRPARLDFKEAVDWGERFATRIVF